MAVNTLGQYGAAQALEAVLRKTQSPATGNVWLMLGTSATTPTDAGTTVANISITEYAATGYSRQVIAWGSATVARPSIISNSGTVTFGPFTTGTGAIVRYAAVVDAVSGTTANVIAVYQLTSDRTPANGDSLQAAAASFTLQV